MKSNPTNENKSNNIKPFGWFLETRFNKIFRFKMKIVIPSIIVTSWVDRILYAGLAAFVDANTET